jgi:hypothetical protein
MNPMGIVGLSGIESMGDDPSGQLPTDPFECMQMAPEYFWNPETGKCEKSPDYVPVGPGGTTPLDVQCQDQGGVWNEQEGSCKIEVKSWPELTRYPTAVEVGKALSYIAMTLGGAYYYGWKGGVAGFFGSAALNSAAGALVYHQQPQAHYKLAFYLTAGLGGVAALIAVPAWLAAERVR